MAELAGKWIPVGDAASTDPHVVFGDDGTWSGSDGCNGAQGRWAVDDAGAFLATAGAMTLIGCEGAPVPTWVASARSAGLDGAFLLLLDVDGTEIVRLRAHGSQERGNHDLREYGNARREARAP